MYEENKTLVFKNCLLIDGNGNEPVEDSYIVVRGNRIEQVNTGKPNLQNSEIIDVEGRTIMPGMIENHAHMKWIKTNEMVNEGVGKFLNAPSN